jgi:hypothetical protein
MCVLAKRARNVALRLRLLLQPVGCFDNCFDNCLAAGALTTAWLLQAASACLQLLCACRRGLVCTADIILDGCQPAAVWWWC